MTLALMPEMSTNAVIFFVHVNKARAPNMLAYAIGFNINYGYEQIPAVSGRIFFPSRYFFVTNRPYLVIPDCEPYCQFDNGNYLP